MKQQRESERQMILNALSIAVQAPDEFAFRYMKSPGYMALTAAKAIKCMPVEVKVRESDKCYLELPISHRGIDMFMTPTTHI